MISYIVAMDNKRTIGANNDLPWHLPADLAHFKRVTSGHTIVMGRKTYESIGRPLPKRRNVILTRNKDFNAEGCEVVHQLEEVLDIAKQEEECFIIGGAELFKLFWNDTDRLYITHIDETFEGDTYFPEIKESEWEKVSDEAGTVDEKNRYPHTFCTYERKK
ncbi:dihydrofolate reductase [Alkalihalophilus marmarensis]|uniref:dihydrofolate reductase n=1 Tax=Alkalihalophilus marmarensis TaxID=521377 RepID=UPI002E1C1589|nr:dihydrofolate reductase [Alkalihalophilus marmarensis]